MCPSSEPAEDLFNKPDGIFFLQGIRPEQNNPNPAVGASPPHLQPHTNHAPTTETITRSVETDPDLIDLDTSNSSASSQQLEISISSDSEENDSPSNIEVTAVDPNSNFMEDTATQPEVSLLVLDNSKLVARDEVNGYLLIKPKSMFGLIVETLLQNAELPQTTTPPALTDALETINLPKPQLPTARNLLVGEKEFKLIIDIAIHNFAKYNELLQLTRDKGLIPDENIPSSFPKPLKDASASSPAVVKKLPLKRLNVFAGEDYGKNIANFCKAFQKAGEELKGVTRAVEVVAETDFPPQLTLTGKIPTKAENTIFHVQSTLTIGCSCPISCYINLDPVQVYSHRLFIERLTRHERSLYLMGIIRCSPFYDGILKRGYTKLDYFSLGRRVCFETFLYLEYCALSQFNRIRKCIIESGEIPSGIPGGISSETLPEFVKSFILHLLKLNTKYNQKEFFYISKEITPKSLYAKYSVYIDYADELGRALMFESFSAILNKQFPNLIFTDIESRAFYEVESMDEFMTRNGMQKIAFCRGNKVDSISFLEVSRHQLLEKFMWQNVYEDVEGLGSQIPIFRLVKKVNV